MSWLRSQNNDVVESLTRTRAQLRVKGGRKTGNVQRCILRFAWIDISTPKPVSSDTAEVPP